MAKKTGVGADGDDGGFSREEQRALALSKRHRVPYASLGNRALKAEPHQGLERVIPENFARENGVLPLFIDGSSISIALPDPGDALTLDMLRLVTGMRVRPFVSTRTELRLAIASFYSAR